MQKLRELQVDDSLFCLDSDIATEGCFLPGHNYKINKITKHNPVPLKVKSALRTRTLVEPMRTWDAELAAPPAPARATKKTAEKEKNTSNINHVTVVCEAGCEHIIDFYGLTTYFRLPNLTVRDLPIWWYL